MSRTNTSFLSCPRRQSSRVGRTKRAANASCRPAASSTASLLSSRLDADPQRTLVETLIKGEARGLVAETVEPSKQARVRIQNGARKEAADFTGIGLCGYVRRVATLFRRIRNEGGQGVQHPAGRQGKAVSRA